MKAPDLPFILSPGLGCPAFLENEGRKFSFKALVAVKDSPGGLTFSLRPSGVNRAEGSIGLKMTAMWEIKGGFNGFPKKMEETMEDVCQEIHTSIFLGKARYFMVILEAVNGFAKGVYDLVLTGGGKELHIKRHAIFFHKREAGVLKFIHYTDLHVARRNDLMEKEISALGGSTAGFVNFNDKVRDFIAEANKMATNGELDFVVIGGDLVDFVNHGVDDEVDPEDNNWRVFEEIMTGGGLESQRGNTGIQVPIFTTTGNHDWRIHPYDPATNSAPYGVAKEVIEKYEYRYYDAQERLDEKFNKVYEKIKNEELPLGVESDIRTLAKSIIVISEYFKRNITVAGLISALSLAGLFFNRPDLATRANIFLTENKNPAGVMLLGLISLIILVVRKLYSNKVGTALRVAVDVAVIPIEARVQSLHYYLLHFNPFFNYAISVGGCSVIIMDTGHDCLVGQYFWDNGKNKLRHLSILDNILGGSPDSMAFYPANEYYTYGQIAWLENMLDLIGEKQGPIFIITHTPPMNLSNSDIPRRTKECFLPEYEFDIRFGTINHYLSQFLHLLVGRKEGGARNGPVVDMVLSGHAHQKVEFRLAAWDGNPYAPRYAGISIAFNPLKVKARRLDIYLGEYSENGGALKAAPYVFQTAGGGPANGAKYPDPPYYRIIEVAGGEIIRAEHTNLKRASN
jgi:predicted MPP superfamily phosphohydrolase